MPTIRQSQKEAIKAALTLNGWFVGYTDDDLVEAVRSCAELNKDEIIRCLNTLDVGNCGVEDYELAERIEDAIYKIQYGVFWRLCEPGKYLLDRKRALNMQAIVDRKPIPFPDCEAG